MERYINGSDILLFSVDKSNPASPVITPVVCLQNLNVTRSRSVTSTETKCGIITTYGLTSYGVTATGLVLWGNDPTVKKAHTDMINVFKNEVKGSWQISPLIPVNGDNVINFDGIVSGLNDALNAGAGATFDLTFAPDNTTWVEGAIVLNDVILSTKAVTAGSVTKGSSNNILYITQVSADNNETPTPITSALTGTVAAGDLGNARLYANANPVLDGSQQLLGTISAAALASGGTLSFTNGTTLPTGTKYLILAVDIAAGAVSTHTIIAGKLGFTGLVGTLTDNQTATGGTKTIA